MGTVLSALLISGILLSVAAIKSPVQVVIRRPQVITTKISLEVWPDAVDDVASAIRAGMALPQAVCHLAKDGPFSLRPTFQQVQNNYLSRGDFIAALEPIRQLQHSVAIKFVSAISIAYQVGGSELGNVLRALSEAVRDEVKLRGEIQARQSWTVNGARLAVAAPWVTVLLLSARNSAAQVYMSSGGIKLLAGCAGLTLLAYFVMVQIGRLPEQKLVAP